MNEELRKKLDENNNFHLTFKVIQISDNELLQKVNKALDNSYILDECKDIYSQLEEFYSNKASYVLCNENITFLLPMVVVITKDVTNLIKVKIPVIYKLKDNKIIQKVKTRCHQLEVPFEACKDDSQIIERIIKIINE